jgi:hypothetical protein
MKSMLGSKKGDKKLEEEDGNGSDVDAVANLDEDGGEIKSKKKDSSK